MGRARKPVVEQPEIVLTRGVPLVIGKATHSKMLSASFLADLQEDYELYGKGIFALMRARFPTKYFDALVSLAKSSLGRPAALIGQRRRQRRWIGSSSALARGRGRCWSSSWSR